MKRINNILSTLIGFGAVTCITLVNAQSVSMGLQYMPSAQESGYQIKYRFNLDKDVFAAIGYEGLGVKRYSSVSNAGVPYYVDIPIQGPFVGVGRYGVVDNKWLPNNYASLSALYSFTNVNDPDRSVSNVGDLLFVGKLGIEPFHYKNRLSLYTELNLLAGHPQFNNFASLAMGLTYKLSKGSSQSQTQQPFSDNETQWGTLEQDSAESPISSNSETPLIEKVSLNQIDAAQSTEIAASRYHNSLSIPGLINGKIVDVFLAGNCSLNAVYRVGVFQQPENALKSRSFVESKGFEAVTFENKADTTRYYVYLLIDHAKFNKRDVENAMQELKIEDAINVCEK